MKKPLISFIVTGDDQTLPLILVDLDQYLTRHKNLTYEIIVSTESEKKKTREITARFTKFVKNLELVMREKNDTKRTLLEVGNTQARGVWRCFIENNTEVPMNEINKIITAIETKKVDNVDLVISSTYVHGAYPVPKPSIKTEFTHALKKIIRSKPKERSPRFLAVQEEPSKELMRHEEYTGKTTLETLLQKGLKTNKTICEIPVFWHAQKILAKA